MAAQSAGLLIHRVRKGAVQVLLVHPGGPLWRKKDAGAWQLPKGLIEPGENEEIAARREVAEELGIAIVGPLVPLGEIRQAGGKRVVAFAIERDFDADAIVSNEIEIEWPPRSGERITIPEIDAARWFTLDAARDMMLPSQVPFLERLENALASIGGRGC